jgi:hypothetical protein
MSCGRTYAFGPSPRRPAFATVLPLRSARTSWPEASVTKTKPSGPATTPSGELMPSDQETAVQSEGDVVRAVQRVPADRC